MDKNKIDNFLVIGLGLIGGSIAKDIRQFYPNANIDVIEPNEVGVSSAIEDGIVNKAITYEEIPKKSYFIILATPIRTVIKIANGIKNVIDEDSSSKSKQFFIIDTASTKAKITKEFEKLTSGNIEYIATHPMAGTEFTGYKHSRKHLFKSKAWMICEHSNNSECALKVTKSFINKLGGKIREIDPELHDQYAAIVSHSIIMLSNYIFDFIFEKSPEALEVAGDGFTSTTRLASGNPELHVDILINNHDFIKQTLGDFNKYLGNKLSNGVIEDKKFFNDNMKNRNSWIHKRS